MDFVRQEEFFARLNAHVFEPGLGRQASRDELRDIVNGIADIVGEIVFEGGSVRFGKLGTFKTHVKPEGRAWDPQRKCHFKCPERHKVVFKQSKSTRNLFKKI